MNNYFKNLQAPKPQPQITLVASDAAIQACIDVGSYTPEPALNRSQKTCICCPKCDDRLFDFTETRMRADKVQVRRVQCFNCKYRSWRLA